MSTTVAVPAGAFDGAIAWAQAHEAALPGDPDGIAWTAAQSKWPTVSTM